MASTNYFKKFPKTIINDRIITNVFNRFHFVENEKILKTKIYFDYHVSENETPEDVALKIYGSTTFFWIILILNNIINIYEEWYKPSYILDDYIIAKYGNLETAHNEIHHFEDANGNYISEDEWDGSELKKVTYYEYEFNKNEANKVISLIRPEYVLQISSEFNKIFK